MEAWIFGQGLTKSHHKSVDPVCTKSFAKINDPFNGHTSDG